MDSTTQLRQDVREILRAIDVLIDSTEYTFLQALPTRKKHKIYGGNKEMLCAAVKYLARESPIGIYISLNPIREKVKRWPKNSDILRRRWQLVDIDRDKTNEPK